MSKLKDVAKRANVSITTVSRYLNKTAIVSPEKIKRIQEAIDELNYKPNLIARSLKLKSSNTVGLVFPDIKDPFFSVLVDVAEGIAHENDYNVILCNTDYDSDKERIYIEVLKKRLVDGYIILPAVTNNKYNYEILKDEKVVFVDQSPGIKNEICVKGNNIKGVLSGMEYLISLGHTRIGVINLPLNMTTGYERYEGYKKALRDHNIKLDKSIVKFADNEQWVKNSFEKTKEILMSEKKPTAIFPMNGPTTIGALKAFRALHLKIPDDISIIGYDDHYYSELFDPPLTTIAQPVEDLGKISMEILLEKIRKKRYKKNQLIQLQPKLILRSSCKKIPISS